MTDIVLNLPAPIPEIGGIDREFFESLPPEI